MSKTPPDTTEADREARAHSLLLALEAADEGELLDGVLGAVGMIQAAGPNGRLLAIEREVIRALVRLAREGDPPAPAAVAVFALGKRHDPTLEGFFVDLLREHVAIEGDVGVLYQAMVALDHLGLAIFNRRDGHSALDAEINRALAEKFLAARRRAGPR